MWGAIKRVKKNTLEENPNLGYKNSGMFKSQTPRRPVDSTD